MGSTAQDAGYHGAHQATEAVNDDLEEAVNEFAAATASNREAFAQLTVTNANLNEQLTNMALQQQQTQTQLQQLQQQYMMLAASNTTNTNQQQQNGGGGRRGGRGGGGNQNNAPNMMNGWGQPYVPAVQGNQPPQMQPGLPPQMQPVPPPQMQPGQPPQMMQGTPMMMQGMPGAPMMMYQPTGPGQSTPQPGNQLQGQFPQGQGPNQCGPQQQNPVRGKWFNNMNYCWTHGGDVSDTHTSATCARPAQGHQVHATRWNIMGGSQRDLQRVWMGQRPPRRGNNNS